MIGLFLFNNRHRKSVPVAFQPGAT